MKTLTIAHILALSVFFSCSSQKENTQSLSQSTEELDEMSIYHLPSKWNTQNAEQIELKDLQGNVLVMVMIYTSCQMACPRLVADMRNIDLQIEENLKKNVKMILVSIDPETDTPERLKKFSIENQMEGNQWLFLQGTTESVREFANVLAVKYKKITPIDFSHSNIISVFDQKGVLRHQQEGLGVDNKSTIEAIINLSKN